ncbi:conserved membrane hypothetical protein [Candidatus Desulfarcum epimagneticum]|uniref:Insecticide toxin TcdB middle/N-terminal domain-containing protein n=1 Tax=uncultured Desulfobacteraceae bacterium TaxID=218296 RepID=A0A484HDW8_9BACT|nr:conserved membrane hypothetical protein [uncultured Desulfobacteraceae bacterium]
MWVQKKIAHCLLALVFTLHTVLIPAVGNAEEYADSPDFETAVEWRGEEDGFNPDFISEDMGDEPLQDFGEDDYDKGFDDQADDFNGAVGESVPEGAKPTPPVPPVDIDVKPEIDISNVEISNATGAVKYSVPIIAPPGRAGIEPGLSLKYSSAVKNGIVGMGWFLNIGFIQRCSKKGVDYSADDYVVMKNGGLHDLASRSDWGSDYYGAKIEEEFSKYYFDSATGGWEVTARDGTKFYYGARSVGRQESGDNVFKWGLEKIEDTNRNYMRIYYTKDQGQLYPDQIVYTGGPVGAFESNYINFVYETRSDAPLSYKTKFSVKTAKRLARIEVYSNATSAANSRLSGGQLVRRYQLTYNQGAHTGRSRLTDVTMYGSDGTTSRPLESFVWQNGGGASHSRGQTITHGNQVLLDSALVDINGDGVSDLVTAEAHPGSGAVLKYSLSNRRGTFNSPVSLDIPLPRSFTAYDFGGFRRDIEIVAKSWWGDINGDGKQDAVVTSINVSGFEVFLHAEVYLNTTPVGGRVSLEHAGGRILERVQGRTPKSKVAGLLDLTGDGLADLVVGDPNGPTNQNRYYQCYPSNGNGTFGAGYNTGLISYKSHWPTITSTVWGDINGDGLVDAMRVDYAPDYPMHGDAILYPYLNSGDRRWHSAHSSRIRFKDSDTGIHLADINGDGMADLIRRPSPSGGNGNYQYQLSNGDGTFAAVRNTTIPNSSGRNVYRDVTSWGDINGDGRADALFGYGTEGWDLWATRKIPASNFQFYYAGGTPTDLITQITSAYGGTTDITYRHSTAYPNTFLPFSFPVASQLVVRDRMSDPDDLPNSSTTGFSYSGGLFNFRNRGFRGFRTVTKTHPDGTTEEADFHQGEFLHGKTETLKMKDPRGTLMERSDYTWEAHESSTGDPWRFARLNRKRVEQYDDLTVFDQEDYAYDGDHGQVTQLITSGTNGEDVTTTFAYQNYGFRADGWTWRKTGEAIEGEFSGKAREKNYGYSPGTGNLESIEYVNDSGVNPTIRFGYDIYGNRTSVTDAKGHVTTISYDTQTHIYPVKIAYPVTGLAKEYTYDYKFGKISTFTDENENVTSYTYDVFGRPVRIDYPDDGQMTIAYTEYQEIVGVFSPAYLLTQIKETGSPTATVETVDQYEYFDGLGRVIRIVTFGENDPIIRPAVAKTILTKIHYDNMGRNHLTEGPAFSTNFTAATGAEASLPSEYPYVRNVYDHRGRLSRVEEPDPAPDAAPGAVIASSYAYSGLKTTVTDPDDRKRSEQTDYLGRIILVIEHMGADRTNTGYSYNAAGDLLNIYDHDGNETENHYDTLGRKTQMIDPDLGTWSYEYDLNGNLKKQTDAKGQIIKFTYDSLNRVDGKSVGNSGFYVYLYDQSPNGKGRLAGILKANLRANGKILIDVKHTYEYDQMGRKTKVTKNIRSNPYVTSYVYDFSGKLTSMTYPGGYTVVYCHVYGSGLISAVVGRWGTGSSDSVTHARFYQYTPDGKPGLISYNNGIFTKYEYNPLSTRLTRITTSRGRGATSVRLEDPHYELRQDKSYTYTPAGDISSIQDHLAGVTYTYSYDDLHRLVQETKTNNGGDDSGVSLTYNDIGNILRKTVGTNQFAYSYDAAHSHAVGSITLNGGTTYTFQYDQNGNMNFGWDFTNPAQVARRTISYNEENMPAGIARCVNDATTDTTFEYDGEGKRVKKAVTGGSTVLYINENYEINDGSPVKYIFAGNLRIAKIVPSTTTGGTVHYFHKDHLGSSSVTTDGRFLGMPPANRAQAVETSEYMPFGSMRAHTGSVVSDYKFTDQELDTSTGLYNYDARLYDPVIGRFVTPDTIVPDVYNPQSLNRYSYCLNNPLIYTDPDGHVGVAGAIFGGFVGAVTGFTTGMMTTDGNMKAAVVGGIVGGVVGVALGFVSPGTSSLGAATAARATLAATIDSAATGAASGAAGGAAAGILEAQEKGESVTKGAVKGAWEGAKSGAVTGPIAAVPGAMVTKMAGPATKFAGTAEKALGATTSFKASVLGKLGELFGRSKKSKARHGMGREEKSGPAGAQSASPQSQAGGKGGGDGKTSPGNQKSDDSDMGDIGP